MEHPIAITLDVVCGKWKGLILWYLHKNKMRFSELKAAMPKVSHKMLAQQLRELEKDGLIERTVYPQVPPRVEYTLTRYGRDLEPILEMMYLWGKNHADKVRKGKKDSN